MFSYSFLCEGVFFTFYWLYIVNNYIINIKIKHLKADGCDGW